MWILSFYRGLFCSAWSVLWAISVYSKVGQSEPLTKELIRYHANGKIMSSPAAALYREGNLNGSE